MPARESYCTRTQPFRGALLVLLASLTTHVASLRLDPHLGASALAGQAASNAQITSNCRAFNANLVCTDCIRDYYVANGICVRVPEGSQIADCAFYASNVTCAKCDDGYYLDQNKTKCIRVSTNVTCQSYLNETACYTCPNGYFLSGNQCQLVPNCAQSDGYNCTVCAAGFYMESKNKCSAVTNGTAIANCDSATSGGICSRCASGFVASMDQKQCIAGSVIDNQIDPRCTDQRLINGTRCAICRQGYLVDGYGRCNKINDFENCLIHHESEPAKCRVCMSGYSMKSLTFTCELNANASNPNSALKDPLNSAAIGKFLGLALSVALAAHLG